LINEETLLGVDELLDVLLMLALEPPLTHPHHHHREEERGSSTHLL
jgi:hypothetical protein